MVDRLFEFLHLFCRNATVVLRWNVRVDRTSGPDCHLPLPFYTAHAFGFTKTHKA